MDRLRSDLPVDPVPARDGQGAFHGTRLYAGLPPVATMDAVQRYVDEERRDTRRFLYWVGGILLTVWVCLTMILVIAGRAERGARDSRRVQPFSSPRVPTHQNELADTPDVARLRDELDQLREGLAAQTRAASNTLTELRRDARRWTIAAAAAVPGEDARVVEGVGVDATASSIPSGVAADVTAGDGDALAVTASADEGVAMTPASHAIGGEVREADPDPVALMGLLPDEELSESLLAQERPEPVTASGVASSSDQTGPIKALTFPNGDRYEGGFSNGLFNGWGIYSHANGDRYEGEFREDMKAGTGTFVTREGDRYLGEFDHDVRHGRGSLVFASGDRYVGEFREDEIGGQGTMSYAEGGKYSGEFANGHKHGSGEFRFANGDIYQGAFRDDVREGQGIYEFANGARYIGEFTGGRREGQGRYVYPSGDEYVGGFRAGKRHGEGTYIYANGNQVRGRWENDCLVGGTSQDGSLPDPRKKVGAISRNLVDGLLDR